MTQVKNLFDALTNETNFLTRGFLGSIEADMLRLEDNFKASTRVEDIDQTLSLLLAENRSDFREMGMNTFGILSDRVTILSCKARLSIDPDARDAAKKQVDNQISGNNEKKTLLLGLHPE